jgi:hypothetical protein
MSARIDPLAQQAEIGGRTYRLRLDCRAEAALVTVEEREYRVRLLQWREKAMLARFASLGEELLMRELVRMCTDASDELSHEAATVLGEVAVWINDPSRAGAGVPFDSRSVATVMLQLCRATQLRPADFDGRSALEVEELWQALGGEKEPARETAANTSGTRIMIVPDPDVQNAGVPLTEQAASTPDLANRDDSATSIVTSPEPERNVSVPAAERTASSGRWRLATWPADGVAGVNAESKEPPRSYVSAAPEHTKAAAAAAALHDATPATTLDAIPEFRGGDARGTRGTVEPARVPFGVRWPQLPLSYVEAAPEHPRAATDEMHGLDRTDRTHRTDRTNSSEASYPSYSSYPSHSSYDSPADHPTTLPSDSQSLFDELADRLTEAAADMGIGEV